MLKKLKIKFVIVIMTIVTVLFGTIFFSIMHLTQKNIELESIQMMRAMVFAPPDSHVSVTPPKGIPDNIRVPLFKIEKNEDGGIEVSGGEYYDLSDMEFIEELFDRASQSKRENGVISEYSLRYMRFENDRKQCIVFADITNEKMILRGLIKNSVLIGLIGYIVFFIISLILAKWVTKPVEKAWNEQKQFIADASHELKTPLTVIITNAEMLSDENYSEINHGEFTKNILSMSKRMRGLIESLLELARMDNGVSAKSFEKINYSKLVSNCVLPFEPLFYEKDMVLSVNIDNDIYVEGDKLKLRQVFDILLDNALKYSSSAEAVKVRLIKHSGHCTLSVAGSGKPLSKAECADIFKRFYQLDKARNDGHSYGLGLSIADSIIKEHHGKIWAESDKNENIFYVSLGCI